MERLYVAQGAGGLLKVGMTSNFDNRKRRLKFQFQERGDELSRYVLCDELEHVGRFEHDAHCELNQRATTRIGREWYLGVDFDEAVSIAKAHTERAKRRPRSEAKEGV